MPQLLLPLRDEYQAITRRISTQITKMVIGSFKLPHDTYIQYNGESNQALLWNSEIQKFDKTVGSDQDGTRFGHYDKITVEAKEEELEEGYGRTTMWRQEMPLIWHDDHLHISLRPYYISKRLSISYTYKSKTMEKADRFRAELTRIITMSRKTIQLDLDYYIIPGRKNIELLNHLFELYQNRTDDKQQFIEYLNKHADNNSLTKITNRKGKGDALAFRERQQDVMAVLQISTTPEKSKRDNSPGYEISFDLEIIYDKPINTVLTYPITVYNQMISAQYIPNIEEYTFTKRKGVTYSPLADSLFDVATVLDHKDPGYTERYGITVPLGDDWITNQNLDDQIPVFTGLVPIHNEGLDTQVIGKLDYYLKYITISPALSHYLSHNTDRVTKQYQSPLSIVVHKDNSLQSYNKIELDDDYQIHYHGKLYFKDTLHVSLTIPKRWLYYDDSFFRHLATYPALCEELISHYTNRILDLDEVARQATALWRSQFSHMSLSTYVRNKVMEAIKTGVQYISQPYWYKILPGLLFNDKSILPRQTGEFIYNTFREWLSFTPIEIEWDDYNPPYLTYRYLVLKHFQFYLLPLLTEEYPSISESVYFGQANPAQLRATLMTASHSHNITPSTFIYSGVRTQMLSYIEVNQT